MFLHNPRRFEILVLVLEFVSQHPSHGIERPDYFWQSPRALPLALQLVQKVKLSSRRCHRLKSQRLSLDPFQFTLGDYVMQFSNIQ